MIEQMRKDIVNKIVEDLYYESDGDYYIISFVGGSEVSVRFMADIVKE